MIQDIEYNGILGSSLKVFSVERPAIPAARPRREETEIPGLGTVYRETGEYEPTEIPVKMNYIGDELKWADRWRKIQKWFAAENGILRFSDDAGYFFKIAYVELDENERPSARTGRFNATFVTRDGLYYPNYGQREHKPDEIVWNPYEKSKPIFKITGEGLCTLSVNGNQMTANVGQNLTIDTERMLAYRQDGILQNTSVTGDYENLYLPAGNIEISITQGFDLVVIPNWRCR